MMPRPDKELKRVALIQFAASGIVVLLTCAVFTYHGRTSLHAAAIVAAVMVGAAAAASVVLVPLLAGIRGKKSRGSAAAASATDREHLYMKTLMDNIPDRVYFKDTESRFLMVSRSYIVSKRLDESIIGKTDFDIFTKEHAQKAYDNEQRIMSTGEPLANQTEKLTMPDGSVSWGLSSKIPVRNEAGVIIGTLGVTKDITSLKETEIELARARDAAVESSRTKSEFLANMSHEIRTPMNGVIGMTGLLLDTELTPVQREFAETIRNSADSLLTIINDILDFSKIEAGKLDLEEVPLDLAGVADNVGRILAGTADAKGLELLVDVHPGVPRALLGDGVRLQQVLLNLGSNAVKFTSEGEVVIRASVLDWNAERVALRFEVIDMGIGIAPADQARLFQAFSQADSSTTRQFGGTGLGLAICRQLVELMGGRIGVTSAPGEGSTFWVELSLRRGETTPSSMS